VANQQQVGIVERAAAVSAGLVLGRQTDGLEWLARLPVRALYRPRDYVLEAAEDSSAVARVLGEPVAVVGLDGVPAPGAFQGHRQ
jgi:hypothetical protein